LAVDRNSKTNIMTQLRELRQINKQEFLQELQKRIQDKQLTEKEVAEVLEAEQ